MLYLRYVFSREKIIMNTLDSANEVHGVEINLSNCSWIFDFSTVKGKLKWYAGEK